MREIIRRIGQPDQDNPMLVELYRRLGSPGGAQILKGTEYVYNPEALAKGVGPYTPIAERLLVTDETYDEIFEAVHGGGAGGA